MQIHEPQKVAIAELNFAAYNPRVMPADEMDALKASMREHGLVLNLVVQKHGMTLIGGHQRVRALRALCDEQGEPMPEYAWASVLDVDDVTAKRLNVALNKIGGEFDPFRLGELMLSLGEHAHDDLKVLAMGFRQQHVDELLALVAQPNDMSTLIGDGGGHVATEAGKVSTMTFDFDTKAQRDEVKSYFKVQLSQRKDTRLGVLLYELVAAAKQGETTTAAAPRRSRGKKA